MWDYGTPLYDIMKGLNNIEISLILFLESAKPWRNEEGFVIMGTRYFLLNSDSLEF